MITVNIASIPNREGLLFETVKSLAISGVVDVFNLYLNGYERIPNWVSKIKADVRAMLLDNSLGDGAKFLDIPSEGFLLTCDDDLIYPPDYIDTMTMAAIREECIVTLHGKRIHTRPVGKYHSKFYMNGFKCLGDVDMNETVDIGGTGVMCFDVEQFRPDVTLFERKNMADIWIAIQAKLACVPIKVLRHRAGYLKYMNPIGTIWEENSTSPEMEAYICDQINRYL